MRVHFVPDSTTRTIVKMFHVILPERTEGYIEITLPVHQHKKTEIIRKFSDEIPLLEAIFYPSEIPKAFEWKDCVNILRQILRGNGWDVKTERARRGYGPVITARKPLRAN